MAGVIVAILLSSCLSSLSSSVGSYGLSSIKLYSNITIDNNTFSSNGYTVGTAPSSDDIISTSSDGPTMCMAKCQLESNCKSWVVKNNQCSLNKEGTGNVITGYKVNNITYFSGSPGNNEKIQASGPETCLTKCDERSSNGCVAWMFSKTDNSCELLKDDSTQPSMQISFR